jgi:hypothetical protein
VPDFLKPLVVMATGGFAFSSRGGFRSTRRRLGWERAMKRRIPGSDPAKGPLAASLAVDLVRDAAGRALKVLDRNLAVAVSIPGRRVVGSRPLLSRFRDFGSRVGGTMTRVVPSTRC